MSVSEEEFNRFQVQFVELKTNNYRLEEERSRTITELLELRLRADNLQRELQHAQEALNKSKRARDLDTLLKENEVIRLKLLSQEEDFRLQYETLMKEFSSIVSDNERLQSQLETYKSGRHLAAARIAACNESNRLASSANVVDVDSVQVELATPSSLCDSKDTELSQRSSPEASAQENSERIRTLRDEITKLCSEKAVEMEHTAEAQQRAEQLGREKRDLLNQKGASDLELDNLRRRLTAVELERNAEKERSEEAVEDMRRVHQAELMRVRGEAERRAADLVFQREQEIVLLRRAFDEKLAHELAVAEEKLRSVEASAAETKKDLCSQLSRVTDEAEELQTSLRTEHDLALHALHCAQAERESALTSAHESLLDEERALVVDLRQRLAALEDKVLDSEHEIKVNEKKGTLVIRDLRRSLQTERRRAAKLEERLRELFSSDLSSHQSLEELFGPGSASAGIQDDRSSITSWGANTSGLSGDSSSTAAEQQSERDLHDLVHKFTMLQSENYALIERVTHLEASNASMAQDLLEKSNIIERFVRISRVDAAALPASSNFLLSSANNTAAGMIGEASCQLENGGIDDTSVSLSDSLPLTLSPLRNRVQQTLRAKLHDFVRPEQAGNLRDMNRKLQHLLEETLTKNIHLQDNLDMLTGELYQLQISQTS